MNFFMIEVYLDRDLYWVYNLQSPSKTLAKNFIACNILEMISPSLYEIFLLKHFNKKQNINENLKKICSPQKLERNNQDLEKMQIPFIFESNVLLKNRILKKKFKDFKTMVLFMKNENNSEFKLIEEINLAETKKNK